MAWDPKKKILVYNGVSRKLVPWAGGLYLFGLPYAFVIFLLVLAPLAGRNKLPIIDYIINLVWLILNFVYLVGESFCLIYGKDFAHSFNLLVAVGKAWDKGKLHDFLPH